MVSIGQNLLNTLDGPTGRYLMPSSVAALRLLFSTASVMRTSDGLLVESTLPCITLVSGQYFARVAASPGPSVGRSSISMTAALHIIIT